MSTTPRYSEQFKKDAVRLVTEKGYSNTKAGRSVGVSHTTIQSWVARYRDEMPERTEFASPEEERDYLRAEIQRLRMEREILEKAADFFAKEKSS